MLVSTVVLLFLLVAVVAAPIVLLVAAANTKCRSQIRSGLTEILGDAWRYRSDQMEESAIQYVESLVEEVQAHSSATILIAHSQGAEISRRVAVERPVDACVWIGSGEVHLGIVRTLRRSRWRLPVVLWCALLVFPILFSVLVSAGWHIVEVLWSAVTATWDAVTGSFQEIGDPTVEPGTAFAQMHESFDGHSDQMISAAIASGVAGLTVLVFAVVAHLLAWLFARNPQDLNDQPECDVIAVKSLLDPVCVGPNKEGTIVRYVPINGSEWLKEHVTYFEKPETGMAIVEAVIGTELMPAPPHQPRIGARVYGFSALAAIGQTALWWWIGDTMMGLLRSVL
jgi:pimeloyl-ACP methyl ester carboxylesterase